MKTRLLAYAAALALLAIASPASAAVNLLSNGGFELPDLNTNPSFGPEAFNPVPGSYVYPGFFGPATYDSWTYNAGGGLINTSVGSNPWYGSTSPSGFEGHQYAFVQGGTTSTLSQTFSSAVAGVTTIQWLEGSRPDFGSFNGAQTYEVLLNNLVLGVFSTLSGQNFELESVNGTLLAGSNTLQFKGLTVDGDHTVFIDDVAVSAIPELSIWGMMLLGFAGIGIVTYRRAKRISSVVA
jgi:hypothetical protein